MSNILLGIVGFAIISALIVLGGTFIYTKLKPKLIERKYKKRYKDNDETK